MQLEPIIVNDLLYKLDEKLIELLRGLEAEDWTKQTLAPKWTVKDVALHLLDGNLRTLSMLRDNHFSKVNRTLNGYSETVAYLNELNSDWIKGTKRLSTKILIELLEYYGREYCSFIETLNPNEMATFSVGWAGEEESKNWFHVAREYTEKWHHQQQIRTAIGENSELLKNEFYFPYLETSMRALPYHYRTVIGETGDLIRVEVIGDKLNRWFLEWKSGDWRLLGETESKPNCEIRIPGNIAWRIFTKGISKNDAITESHINGDKRLGLRMFELIAVMA